MNKIIINEAHIRQIVRETLENLILGEDDIENNMEAELRYEPITLDLLISEIKNECGYMDYAFKNDNLYRGEFKGDKYYSEVEYEGIKVNSDSIVFTIKCGDWRVSEDEDGVWTDSVKVYGVSCYNEDWDEMQDFDNLTEYQTKFFEKLLLSDNDLVDYVYDGPYDPSDEQYDIWRDNHLDLD